MNIAKAFLHGIGEREIRESFRFRQRTSGDALDGGMTSRFGGRSNKRCEEQLKVGKAVGVDRR